MPTWTTFTEPGGHVDNEDAFAVMSHPMDPDCVLCFIADGMGGQAGGGLAARTACRVGLERACALPLSKLSSPSEWVTLLHTVDTTVEAEEGVAIRRSSGSACGEPRWSARRAAIARRC